MNPNLNAQIKKEFDALIYSVLDSDKLTDSVIKRLQARRRKLFLKIFAGALISLLIVLAGNYFMNSNIFHRETVVTYKLEGSITEPGILTLPFSQFLDVDGSNPSKSHFEFETNLTQNQTVIFWTHTTIRTHGVIGSMTLAIKDQGDEYKNLQVFDIGSFTNRQEMNIPSSGRYRFHLDITDKSIQTTLAVSIVTIPKG